MKSKKIITAILSLSAAAVMCFGMTACTDSGNNSSAADATSATSAASATSAEEDDAAVKTGEFVITLHPEFAPKTCENFEKLVKDGFYTNSSFHRIYPGFMAQGGQPAEGKEEASTIKGEFVENGVKTNTLSHVGAIVSMARATDPDSANSQFFICFNDIAKENTDYLNGKYAAFGQVTEGMDVIDDLEKIDVQDNGAGEVSSPVKPVTIEKAEMIEDDKDGNHRAKFTIKYTPGSEKDSTSATDSSASSEESSK